MSVRVMNDTDSHFYDLLMSILLNTVDVLLMVVDVLIMVKCE